VFSSFPRRTPCDISVRRCSFSTSSRGCFSHAGQFKGYNVVRIRCAEQPSNHRKFAGTIYAKLSALCWRLHPHDKIGHYQRRQQQTSRRELGENSRPALSSCVETHQSSAWKWRIRMFIVGDLKQNTLFAKLGRISPRMETVHGFWSSRKCGVSSGISLLRNANESRRADEPAINGV
jgi:hypothetical protein